MICKKRVVRNKQVYKKFKVDGNRKEYREILIDIFKIEETNAPLIRYNWKREYY